MEMKDYVTTGLETFAECSVVGIGIGLIGKALGLPKWAIFGISFIPGAIIGYKNAKKASNCKFTVKPSYFKIHTQPWGEFDKD